MIDDLRAFAAVLDEKSLTRAASKLHLTQSAISRRIQQLEETLGASLLDRTNRPPTPTLLGSRVYEKAIPILRAVDQLVILPQGNAAPSGTFRLGVAHAIGDMILANSIKRMREEFPLLDVRLRTEWSTGLSQQVIRSDLDAAVILLPAGARPAAPLIGRYVASLDVVIVQSKQHPILTQGVPMSALAKEGWILNPQGCGYRAELARAIGETGESLRVVVDTYGTELQLRMIAAGLGLGVVPRSVLRASMSFDEISIVEIFDFSMTLDIWLVHLRELGNLTKAVDALAETVEAGFKPYAGVGPDAPIGGTRPNQPSAGFPSAIPAHRPHSGPAEKPDRRRG
jgi:DNA-binding transcriptional LysR family regulator